MKELVSESTAKIVEKFKPRCEEIVIGASKYFVDHAHRYPNHESFLENLVEQIFSVL